MRQPLNVPNLTLTINECTYGDIVTTKPTIQIHLPHAQKHTYHLSRYLNSFGYGNILTQSLSFIHAYPLKLRPLPPPLLSTTPISNHHYIPH
jgi:hypothetical protein